MVDTCDINNGSPTDKRINLDQDPFALCLQQEIEFLKTGSMELLVDPKEIYDGKVKELWDDTMAYLNDNIIGENNPKHRTLPIKKIEIW